MRIAHVITGLGAGGTPVMLHKVLASQQSMPEIESCVVGMIEDGPIGTKIRETGVPVTTLGMHPGVPDPRSLWKLGRTLRAFRPDLIQSWLYHADLMSSLVQPWIGRPPVVWNLRHATLDTEHDSRSTRWTAKACAWISGWSPDRILVNTVSGQRVHEAYGYDRSKLQVVPNGFDLDRYRPSVEARVEVRKSLGLTPDSILVGLIARFSELKNQELFIRAMSRLASRIPDVHFVMCGYRIHAENERLLQWVQASGCGERFHLLGERLDVERIHAALDLEVSSSVSEAFSNSIGEAMCCGVPCVVTDVGDSAWLVADPSLVVPSQDVGAMTQTCLRLLLATPQERQTLARRVRQRMEQHFDIEVIARQYRDIWQEVLAGQRGNQSTLPATMPSALPPLNESRRAA